MFRIETRRVALRPFTSEDASVVQRLAGDWNVAKTLALVPHPYSDGLAAQWIATHRDLAKSGTEYVFAITRQPDGELMGAISLRPKSGKYGELGYWLGPPYWGRGYATDAAQCMEAVAFDWLNMPQLTTTALKRNKASHRVLEKSYFRKMRVSHLEFRDEPGLLPFVIFRITREEWAAAPRI